MPRRERLRRDAPLLRLRALFRTGRGGHSLFSCRAHWISLDRGRPRGTRAVRRGALASGACALERSVRVLHRRRARVENGAFPVFRTASAHGAFRASARAVQPRRPFRRVRGALGIRHRRGDRALARACRALSRRPETVLSGGRMRSRSHAADAAHRAAARFIRLCAERAQHVPPASRAAGSSPFGAERRERARGLRRHQRHGDAGFAFADVPAALGRGAARPGAHGDAGRRRA